MTSKVSLSDTLSDKLIHKGFFFSDLKRFWWVSALYTIALLLIMPVYHLLQGTSEENKWILENLQDALNILPRASEFQIIFIYFVPVFLAVLLFMYLHSGKATATVHSLPITRNQLFLTHSAAGIVLLTIPVVITGLTLMAAQQMTFLKDVYSVGDIFSWMGYTLLFNLLFFAITVFVGMFTGNPITHGIFTYILIALPIGLIELLRYNLSLLLFGYSNALLHQPLIDSLPIYALLSNYVGEGNFTGGHIAGTLIITAIIFALALLAYRKRDLETAGDVVTFSIVRPVFKYGVTVCTMLLVGAYFAIISQESTAMLVFGYLFGSFLGYVIAEMLLKKSFRIWRQGYKGYVAYALLLTLALFVVEGDVFGFVHRVPEPQEIEEVYFGPRIYAWMQMNTQTDAASESEEEHYQGGGQSSGGFFKSPKNIASVVDLHSQIVLQEDPEGTSNQFIIYSLKNGKSLMRQYNIDEEKFACLLKPIYESTEYKEARFPVLKQPLGEIKMMEVYDTRTQKDAILITNDVEVSQLTEALRQDLQDLTFDEMSRNKHNEPQLMITDIKNKSINYSLRDSYSATWQWLQEKGYLEQAILNPEEIGYVELMRQQSSPDSASERTEIRDPKLIEELLEKSGYSNYQNAEDAIVVIFYVKTNYGVGVAGFEEFIFKNTPVSPELKQYLNQTN